MAEMDTGFRRCDGIVLSATTSLVEPDRSQILIDIVARPDLPAFDVCAVGHDPLPPQQVDRMSLLVEDVFGEFKQIGPLLGLVEFAQLAVVHLDFLWVVELAVVRAGHRMQQIFADIGERIDDVLAIALGADIKISAAQRFEPWPGRYYLLGYVQSDLVPLVDDPDAIIFVRLIDVAVEQFEAEPPRRRLL